MSTPLSDKPSLSRNKFLTALDGRKIDVDKAELLLAAALPDDPDARAALIDCLEGAAAGETPDRFVRGAAEAQELWNRLKSLDSNSADPEVLALSDPQTFKPWTLGVFMKAVEPALNATGGEAPVKPPVTLIPASPQNYGSRGGVDIDAIIIHDTEDESSGSDGVPGSARYFQDPDAGVSAHYMVGQDGTIYQLVADEKRAFHAGVAKLHGESNPTVNARSIGIEIVNKGDGSSPFTDAQYDALNALLKYLVATYQVSRDNVVGHKDVAPGRKHDPGSNFSYPRALAGIYE